MAKKGKALSLNDKQQAFCLQYLVDFNATKAAMRAGYSPKTAYSQGFDLLKKPEVQTFLNEKKAKIADKLEISRERTMKEISRLAFQDARQFFDENGELIPIHQLSDDAAACLAGMDVDEIFDWADGMKVRVGVTKKIKRYDKTKALEMLAKHFNIYTDAPQNNNFITVGYGKEE